MAVNLAQIYDLLRPGLRGVVGQYDQIPTQWDKVFEKGKSDMALERTAEMRSHAPPPPARANDSPLAA